MNKFTFKELQKISHLISGGWDENSTHLVVYADGSQPDLLAIGTTSKVRLANYILHQPPNFTLAENWNQGTYPPEEVLYIEVVQQIGQMIGVRAKGETTGKMWEGWLPRKGITVL